MQPSAPPRPLTGPLRHWPTIVVAAYAVAAFSWTMPVGLFPPKPLIDRASSPLMTLCGLWQSWEMFSPEPRRDDIRVEVRFVNRDGTSHRLMLTAMNSMGYGERMQRERWRKFFNDHLRLDEESRLWQPFVEFMARALREEGQDPATIELIRWWRTAEPLVSPALRPDVRADPWHSYTFYRRQVRPESGP